MFLGRDRYRPRALQTDPGAIRNVAEFLSCTLGRETRFSLLLYDNGPENQSGIVPAYPGLRYVHDPSNGRLYAAYTYALRWAEAHGLPWLMVLDQDTDLTPEYVSEALALCSQVSSSTCAIVPRLIVQGQQRSPHMLYPRDRQREAPFNEISSYPLSAWNSGAMFRVAALRQVGGFPAEFPLDNLDYAVFAALQPKNPAAGEGREIFVMKSCLQHSLSVAELDTLPRARLRDKLAADLLFQYRFNLRTRSSLAWEFFRTGVSLLRKLPDKRMGLLCFRFSAVCLFGTAPTSRANAAVLPGSDAPVFRVSVAMCTYNGAQFLPRQLGSILRQIKLPDELVVCDDGSTDATIALLESFAQTAPFPVRIHRNPVTLGPAGNFAHCLSLCQGDAIVLTDQDDLWSATRIAETAPAFATDPGLTFTFSDSPLIDSDDQPLGRTIFSTVPISAADRRRLRKGTTLLPVLLRWGVLYGTTMALRGSLRPYILPIPQGWSHDEWTGLVLSSLGPSKRLEPVTSYRQHASQQVGTGNWTMETHLGLAKDHGPAFYRRELLRFEAALAAIQGHPQLQLRLRPALERKVEFLRLRLEVQQGGFRRLPLFLRMLLSGSYGRFASALRSPVKDLLMLAGGFARSR